MEISLFLAKALGLFYYIVGAGMILNARNLKLAIRDYMNTPTAYFLGGLCALIIGVLMVISHNIWTLDWRLLVTLLGWMGMLKGIIWGLFPRWISKEEKEWMLNDKLYAFACLVIFSIGLFLCYKGFLQQAL